MTVTEVAFLATDAHRPPAATTGLRFRPRSLARFIGVPLGAALTGRAKVRVYKAIDQLVKQGGGDLHAARATTLPKHAL